MAVEYNLPNRDLPRKSGEFILPLAVDTLNPVKYFLNLPKEEQDTNSDYYSLPEHSTGADREVARSYLGTPVLSNLVFQSGSYKENGKIVQYQGLELNTVIIAVSQSKNIVKTPIQGKNGTVKEYISDGDYAITVNGLMTSRVTDQYPEQAVETFIKLMKVNKALEFTSEFIDRFGSYNAVVESYSLPQTEGFRNSQAFTISMVTDQTIELQLREEE